MLIWARRELRGPAECMNDATPRGETLAEAEPAFSPPNHRCSCLRSVYTHLPAALPCCGRCRLYAPRNVTRLPRAAGQPWHSRVLSATFPPALLSSSLNDYITRYFVTVYKPRLPHALAASADRPASPGRFLDPLLTAPLQLLSWTTRSRHV